MSETAIEPSPTALATRLIERARTSPATNTPGTLVSSRYGSRGSGQPSPATSGPARMNPRASRRTTPSSQSVRGAAPMNTKHASTSSSDSAPSAVADAQRPQPVVLALRRDGRRVRPHVDVRQRRELLDEVVRHRPLDRRAAHEHRHLPRVAGEVHGRLAGGVRRADDRDVLLRARARLGQRRAVVDARAGALGEPRRVVLAVGDARRDQHAVGAQARRRPTARRSARRPRRAAPTASCTVNSSAPSRRAWSVARRARSEPLRPVGKPR